MAQYQSFPGAAGDSLTLDKLKALRLPALAGKRFLDVGCNEGFFCGYAAYDGAVRSVGLDQSALFIERARARFPRCEFIQSGWESLPAEKFDVILLASALHYAEDQAALIHTLVDQLARDGVLVLELGIAASAKSEWVRVTRGIDVRWFPSMLMLKDVLAPYAWKWMGPSVSQDGDPVNRHVLHISRPRPVAYLLMQPPAYGKTSIARSLFAPAGVPVVSGDAVISDIATGKREAPAPLCTMLAEDYSPFRIDEAIHRVFAGGLGPELVKVWIADARGESFALDMYVPLDEHALVEQTFVDAGYMPVTLRWDRVGGGLPSQEDARRQADAFYLSLVDPASASVVPPADAPWVPAGCGFVDDLRLPDGQLVIRGWAVGADGAMPPAIQVSFAGRTTVVENYERQIRHDVQKHLGLPHALVGYRIVVDWPRKASRELPKNLAVAIPGGARFEFAGPIEKMVVEEK